MNAASSSSGSASVPFARGFKLPTTQERRQAVLTASELARGTLEESLAALEPAYQMIESDFNALPAPRDPHDWLAQYVEEEQSVARFQDECPWLSKRKWRGVTVKFSRSGKTMMEKYPTGVIYILPLGEFNSPTAPSPQVLAEFATGFLQVPVRVLPLVHLHENPGSDSLIWTPEEVSPSTTPSTSPSSSSGSSPSQPRRSRRRRTSSSSSTPSPSSSQPRSSTSRRPARRRLVKCRRHSSGKRQLSVSSVLNILRNRDGSERVMPDDGLALIALTMEDLFDTPPDLFVAGMASGAARVAVFSLHRYDPALCFSSELWHDVYLTPIDDAGKHVDTQYESQESLFTPQQNACRQKLVLLRSCRLLVHELGHLLGLDHCIFYDCIMNGSGHLEEDFRQPMHLCPVDLRKLQLLSGFEPVARYRQILTFFLEHNMREECSWVRRRLATIQGHQGAQHARAVLKRKRASRGHTGAGNGRAEPDDEQDEDDDEDEEEDDDDDEDEDNGDDDVDMLPLRERLARRRKRTRS